MAEKVDQDVREAAASYIGSIDPFHDPIVRHAGQIRRGDDDDSLVVQAFARMKAAGREQGLREAAEVAMRLHALPRLAPADAYDELPRVEGAITYAPQDVDCYDATARRIAAAIEALSEKPA